MYQQVMDAMTGQISTKTVQRLSDGAFVPMEVPENTDCAVYLAWVSAGNTPQPPED